MNDKQPDAPRVRLDKWLWAARFYKTRAVAVEFIEKGRFQVNGQAVKRGRELHVGDLVSLRQGAHGEVARELRVLGLSEQRGPAPRRDAREHRGTRSGRRRAPVRRGPGASHRPGPPDQAQPARARAVATLERERRARLKRRPPWATLRRRPA